MSSFSDLLVSTPFLVRCLNAALASAAACALAILLSRRRTWSLPARHAVLVAAIVISLLAPLVVPLFHPPAIWAFGVSATADRVEPTAGSQPNRLIPSANSQESPASNPIPIPVADTNPNRPVVAEPPVVRRVAAVPDSPPRSPAHEEPTVTAADWVRMLGSLLCGIWFVGIAVGGLRFILSLVRLKVWRQTLTASDSPLLAVAARWAAKEMGLRKEVGVQCSNCLPTPVTVGLIHPRIVVPAGIESSLSKEQWRAVLLHEMAHIARRDLWISLLQQIAQIGYWWNPLVCLVNRQLADLREQICDDIALREHIDPGNYAATLISIAERAAEGPPVPATLGIGSSPARQLERRIQRILAPPASKRLWLTPHALIGVAVASLLMTATVLFAQVQVKTSDRPTGDSPRSAAVRPAIAETRPAPANPTLHDLIQEMAAYEQRYFPFEVQVMETFRFPDDLTPQEKARNLRADGRKHQKLMEYAQLAKRIWRSKETIFVDDELEQGPYERFSDGQQIVQRSPSSVTINGVTDTEYYINNRQNDIFNYLSAEPLLGVLCLSMYGRGELFSEAFKEDEEAVDLAWDNGDAKLTFVFGKPHWNTQYVLWLSRAHAWQPIRLQRYMDAKDKFWFDEWEVTKFVPHGKLWRVAEGTHRYRDWRDKEIADPKIKYSMDFKVLSEKYGRDVDEKQFHIEIPKGAKVRVQGQAEAEPPLPAKTREITVTVVDVVGKPIPQASVKLPATRLRNHDLMRTDAQGVARSAKAPADNVTVQITADGFRPVTWIMGNVNKLRAIMVPLSPGIVVDEQGNPVADAWITHEHLQIRADGITHVPDRDWNGKDKDWSGADGHFRLKTNLTLRRNDALVSYIAVNPNRDKMAIAFVPARKLGEPKTLVLEPVCDVQGHCLFLETAELVNVGIGLETSHGESIGWLSPRKALTPKGLRIDFEIRLPPGDYVLASPQTSLHAGFKIPFSVAAGRKDLDLGTKTVSPAGTAALKGKPAPKLDVQWRSGQETNWEKLRGKVVVLDFWGTWCGPCIAGMPELMEIADRFRGRPVEWLSVHTPDLKTFEDLDRQMKSCQKKSWNNRELPFMTVIDRPVIGAEYSGQTSRRFGVVEWPTLIVVDQQGRVVGSDSQKGSRKDNRPPAKP